MTKITVYTKGTQTPSAVELVKHTRFLGKNFSFIKHNCRFQCVKAILEENPGGLHFHKFGLTKNKYALITSNQILDILVLLESRK